MKRHAYLNYNSLPMEKAYNVRELGGYAARKGKITKYHEFLRSDSLTKITQEDQRFLLDYGLATAIDLRASEETVIYPNPFRDSEKVKYINIPFVTDYVKDVRAIKEEGFSVERFYIELVEYKEKVSEIMRFITQHADGCILFHCQAGKDRTGVIAMILLGICGVSKEDILANYQVTHTYLKDHVDLRLSEGLEILEHSEPKWIESAYEHIINQYGSFKKYLISTGLTKKEIKQLRRKLV